MLIKTDLNKKEFNDLKVEFYAIMRELNNARIDNDPTMIAYFTDLLIQDIHELLNSFE